MKVIGICGYRGSGKDTIASVLVREFGFIQISFAEVLKKVISVLFGWSYKKLQGLTEEDRKWRTEVDSWWSEKLGFEVTPVFAMQNIGTDVFRNHFHNDIWILSMERMMMNMCSEQGTDKFVVSDCRFPNEFEWIRKFEGSKIIRVLRPGTGNETHISENLWMNENVNVEVLNNGSIDDLVLKVKEYVADLCYD